MDNRFTVFAELTLRRNGARMCFNPARVTAVLSDGINGASIIHGDLESEVEEEAAEVLRRFHEAQVEVEIYTAPPLAGSIAVRLIRRLAKAFDDGTTLDAKLALIDELSAWADSQPDPHGGAAFAVDEVRRLVEAAEAVLRAANSSGAHLTGFTALQQAVSAIRGEAS